MVDESELVSTEHGLVPKGQGWFVINAREAQWWDRKGRGALCEFEGAGFEGATDFLQLGINITVLAPRRADGDVPLRERPGGFPRARRRGAGHRRRRGAPAAPWDFLHCPAGTNHAIVGAGDGPCLVLAVGARDRSTGPDWGGYTVDKAAQRHGAGVERETTDAAEAYAHLGKGELGRYRESWLP